MNYLVNMLAKPRRITTAQMDERDVEKAMSIYLRNSVVSLCSAKQLNKSIECVLYTNFNIKQDIYKLFNKYEIKVKYLDFGAHSMGESYSWDIVNYRYDVMKDLCSCISDNDKVIIIDTDTICMHELDAVYKELDSNLLMYDVQHSINHKDRNAILDNYKKIYGIEANISHYGGEFIGANRMILKELYDACKKVIDESKDVKNLLMWNDEHVTSIAIQRNIKNHVHSANAYINRYWTGRGFYLVSTNYINNPVCIWHVPNEKKYGILKIYNHFIKSGKFPRVMKMAKILGFPKSRRPFSIKFYVSRIINKAIVWRD